MNSHKFKVGDTVVVTGNVNHGRTGKITDIQDTYVDGENIIYIIDYLYSFTLPELTLIDCIPGCKKTGDHDTCSVFISGIDNVTGCERTEPAPTIQPYELESLRIRSEGGAPTRATTLPDDAKLRKNFPVASGVLDYFPDALVAVSEVSKKGNDQHNPGLPLRWTRGKSGDEADTCIRHFLQRGTMDVDGSRHTAKAAWRMLALLQKEIEESQDKGNK